MKLSFVVPAMCLALTTPVLLAAQGNAVASGRVAPSSPSGNRHSSHLALRILDEVEQAKQSLTARQTQAANGHIDRALADRDRLASMSPTSSQPVIVPLYWEFDDTSVLGRAMAARKDGKRLPSSKSTPVTVDQAGEQYTFVGLDLGKVRLRLDAAKSALSQNNPQAAIASLDRIGNELVVITVKAEYPLLAARENLGLAELAIQKQRYTEAAAALKEAGATLDQYASQQSAHRPHEAKSLSKRIDALSQTIAQNHANASSKVDGWWNVVNGWFTHPIKD